MTKELELPELPEPAWPSPVARQPYYTADQMRAYAAATLAKTQEGGDLVVEIFYQAGDPPFICAVRGNVTTFSLEQIEKDVCENHPHEFDTHGDGTYTFSAHYFSGQYGEYGQCEFPPGFELNFIGYEDIDAATTVLALIAQQKAPEGEEPTEAQTLAAMQAYSSGKNDFRESIRRALIAAKLTPPEQPAVELEEIRSLARHWRIQDSQIGQGSAGNKARRRCSDELIALLDGAKAGREKGEEAQPERTGTVSDIPDDELLRRGLYNVIRSNKRKVPAWSKASAIFGLGSTYAAQLCERFNRDPDTGKPIATPATEPERDGGEL